MEKKPLVISLIFFVGAAFIMAQPTSSASKSTAPLSAVQRISKGNRSGIAATVRVPDGPLVFTGQVFPGDVSGDARSQAEQAVQRAHGS